MCLTVTSILQRNTNQSYQTHALTTRTSPLPGKCIPFRKTWHICLNPMKMFFWGGKKNENVEKFNQYYLIILPSSGCSQLIDIEQTVLEQTYQSHHGTVTGSASLQPRISYLFFFFFKCIIFQWEKHIVLLMSAQVGKLYGALLLSPHTPIIP